MTKPPLVWIQLDWWTISKMMIVPQLMNIEGIGMKPVVFFIILYVHLRENLRFTQTQIWKFYYILFLVPLNFITRNVLGALKSQNFVFYQSHSPDRYALYK